VLKKERYYQENGSEREAEAIQKTNRRPRFGFILGQVSGAGPLGGIWWRNLLLCKDLPKRDNFPVE